MEGIRRKSYSVIVIEEVVIERVVKEEVWRRARMLVEDSIVRKTDRALSKGEDAVVCFPWAKIEAITDSVEQIMDPGNGGSIVVHI